MLTRSYIVILSLIATSTIISASGQKLQAELYITGSQSFGGSNRRESENVWKGQITDDIVELKFPLINIPKKSLDNGTLWCHFVIDSLQLKRTTQINTYKPRKTIKKVRNLLFDPPIIEETEEEKNQHISFLKQKWSLYVVRPDSNDKEQRNPNLLYITSVDIDDQVSHPINETMPKLPFDITIKQVTQEEFQWVRQVEESFKQQAKMFGSTDKDFDEIKGLFLGSNRNLLYITAGVSFLHLLLDFLAFKNDVAFWKNAESFEGLSIKSLFLNVVSQSIVFLYLLEEETSFLVLISVSAGIAIEIWKIFRAVNFKVQFKGGFSVKMAEKGDQNSPSKQYDAMALSILGKILFPIVITYSFYCLYYYKYTGWYAWFISTLTACVYTFGFVRMTPQLFINYKMKSVAHLPWRAFGYKAVNTFIDDLFAFVIKMPTMHRMSVFRDDIVFLVYLYQRWIYPVDSKRVNEFGQTADDSKVQKKTK